MILKKQHKKQVIDLTGPQGNAFVLLGIASSLYKQVGKEYFNEVNGEEITWAGIQKKMMGGDYENLIQIFDKFFGQFVDLER